MRDLDKMKISIEMGKKKAIHYYDCNTGKVWKTRKYLNISKHLPYGPVKTIKTLEFMQKLGMTHILCVGYENDTQIGVTETFKGKETQAQCIRRACEEELGLTFERRIQFNKGPKHKNPDRMVYCSVVHASNLTPSKKIKTTEVPDNKSKKLQMFIGGTLKQCVNLIKHVDSGIIGEGDIRKIVILPINKAIWSCTNNNFN